MSLVTMPSSNYQYIGCCVELTGEFITYIVENAKEISARKMKILVPNYEQENPYPGKNKIPLSRDWAVSFSVSKTPSGKNVAFFTHSHIEYVFVQGARDFDIDVETELAKKAMWQESNWYGKYKLSYDQEMAFLKNRLRAGFDPYDYTNDVAYFLEEEGIEFEHNNELENYEIGELWIPQATPEQIKKFEIYIENRDSRSIEETLEPATRHMEFTKIQKPGWLIHFTYKPLDIAKEGFKFGHAEFEGLGLTTWKNDRKKYAGFNFGFEIGRDAEIAAREKKYGSHAVVFWASGVQAYHYGDEEQQVIFWGPSVNTNMIFPMTSDRNDWTVEAANGRVMVKDKPFNEAVNWIVNNWRMLQNIKGK